MERGESYDKIRFETVATGCVVHVRFLYVRYELVVIADVRDHAEHVLHGIPVSDLILSSDPLRIQIQIDLPHKLLFGKRATFVTNIIERYVGSVDTVFEIGS